MTDTISKENIEQIRLFVKEQYEALFKINYMLNSAVYESTLIKDSLDLIIRVVNSNGALVAKYNEEYNKFTVISSRNIDQGNINNLSEVYSGLLQKVVEKNGSCFYRPEQDDSGISDFENIYISNKSSLIGVPIRRNDKIWGVILAESSVDGREFSDESLLFLDFFSNLLSLSLDKIIQLSQLQEENLIFKNRIESLKSIPDIIGESPAMKNISALIQKVAGTDATVLLQGENGTGKELVAKAIHNLSPRANKPYLVQYCGSIPDSLLERDLFGYNRGAFPGAESDKKGLFEVANHGTFFLDEVGDISPALQNRILRILQNREIMRIGDFQAKKIDVRMIVSTNKDIKQLSREGKFREELFYKLNVFPIKLPPLRERREDISLLTKNFINKFTDKKIRISLQALKILEEYSWPGNIRQLENVVQRAVILCDTDKLMPEHILLEEESDDNKEFVGTLKEFEKLLLKDRLKKFDGNRTITAKSLGVSIRWVQLKIKEL